ncbi:serine/threonine-protein kinase [Streptoalloteichus hindustanus]|uniref:Serine/threonine protein kinase n=1 Tax=Streptoalloteichus hindustanus TaxID=2017 RepID=A0A1M5AEL6_STRHI|nr:serine/threonine-protein kinase [Streptoalloteichus hindustanus]SHF28595.1 Serine/threonine protein kinase [Streptoalloteichus hindustanus]
MQPLSADDPDRVGGYALLGRLGRGAMGAVYLARSRGGRPVAVKVVKAELAEDPTFRERFRREVASARAVGGFWTAAVVDADTEAPRPWFASEYVAGPTLHEAVTRHGPLPEHAVRLLGAGLAEALAAIHGANLVHRDLKPGNVLLGADGPRVIDFGISRALERAGLTMTGMFFGTPGFFSPEQTTGEEIGPPSDVFSLGAVLVFAATGVGPFGDGHTTAMLYRVVHAEADLSRLSPGLRALIGPCLAKNPAARPSAEQLLAAIGDHGGSTREATSWLPAAVTTLIDERTALVAAPPPRRPTLVVPAPGVPAPGVPAPGVPAPTRVGPPVGQPTLVATAEAPVAAPPPARLPPPPSPKPPTQVMTAPEEPPAEAGPPLPVAAVQAVSRAVEKVRAGNAARQRARAATQAAAQRLEQAMAGGVRFAAAKAGSVFFGVLGLTLAAGLVYMINLRGTPSNLGVVLTAALACAYFAGSGVLSLVRAALPSVELVVSPVGVTLCQGRRRRHLDWHHITRIGVVGRGRRQYLVAWLAAGVDVPNALVGHRFRPHQGGIRLFPLGGGNRPRREVRQHARDVRAALAHYARGCYDPQL